MGSVEGERLWGREYVQDATRLCFFEDDRTILAYNSLGTLIAIDCKDGEVFAEFDFKEDIDPKTIGNDANLNVT